MKLITGQEMVKIDRRTIEEVGIDGLILMEKAGQGVADKATAIVNDKKSNILILCGRGNNGGDGLVAARILSQQDYNVQVIIFGRRELSKDAQVNHDILANLGLEIIYLNEVDSLWDRMRNFNYSLIIDCLLGTGIKGSVSPLMEQVINCINSQQAPVLSVDIPTGVNACTGEIMGTAVEANYTVTFVLAKLGLMVYPGCIYSGEVQICDIGIPRYIIEESDIQAAGVNNTWANKHYPYRGKEAYKGSVGRILIVGGSIGMSGAPVLAAYGAFRSGAGVITLGIPASLNSIFEVKATEAMTMPLEDNQRGLLSRKALEPLLKKAEKMDFVVLGPGLGQGEDINYLVEGLIKECNTPLLLDADGINALSDPALLKDRPQKTILTPHYGEMGRLLKSDRQKVVAAPLTVARAFAQQWGVSLILKGPNTITALPDGFIFVNQSGNAGMATAGAGDVLSGVIAGLSGQMLSFFEAAVLGVYLHGLAGDKAVADKGIYGITAQDLIDYLPQAWQAIQEGEVENGNGFDPAPGLGRYLP